MFLGSGCSRIHTTGVFSLFFVEFCDVPTLRIDHPEGELANVSDYMSERKVEKT